MGVSSFISSSRNAPKAWRITVWTAFFVALLSFAVNYGVGLVDENHQSLTSMLKLITPQADYDVVFMGDSRAHAGIAPSVFTQEVEKQTGEKLHAINLSRPGMQAPFTYLIFKRYLETAAKPPKYLFIDFTFYLLGEQIPFRNDFYISYYTPTLAEAKELSKNGVLSRKEAKNWYVYTRIPFLRYRKRLTNLVEMYLKDPDTFYKEMDNTAKSRGINDSPVYLGQSPHPGEVMNPDNIYDEYRTNHAEGFDHYLSYWDKLFELAEKSNVRVVLYEYPWPGQLNTPQFNALLDMYHTLFRAHIHNNSNVELHLDNTFWPYSYFFDQQHLNKDGSEKLSAGLARIYANPKRSLPEASGIPVATTRTAAANKARTGQCGAAGKDADAIKAGLYYLPSQRSCIWNVDEQKFTAQQAKEYCAAHGAQLCTKRQLADAQLAGLSWCPWSWIQSAAGDTGQPVAMHPMRERDDPACGNKTVLPTGTQSATENAGVSCCSLPQ